MTQPTRDYGAALRDYRRRQAVTQQELAEELGYTHASHVHRRETSGKLTRMEYVQMIAAIERIVYARLQADPTEVLS